MSGQLRVVKVGCSLFERPRLADALRSWLHEQTPAVHLFVAGAGELADTIKNWDARFQLGEASSHWLAIRALGITARILAHLHNCELLEDWNEVRDWVAAARQQRGTLAAVVDLENFLRVIEPQALPEPLPHTWQVTTDSLAARLAEILQADELVLLKARNPPAEVTDFHTLAAEGFVDEYFPLIAARLPKVTLLQLPLTAEDD